MATSQRERVLVIGCAVFVILFATFGLVVFAIGGP